MNNFLPLYPRKYNDFLPFYPKYPYHTKLAGIEDILGPWFEFLPSESSRGFEFPSYRKFRETRPQEYKAPALNERILSQYHSQQTQIERYLEYNNALLKQLLDPFIVVEADGTRRIVVPDDLLDHVKTTIKIWRRIHTDLTLPDEYVTDWHERIPSPQLIEATARLLLWHKELIRKKAGAATFLHEALVSFKSDLDVWYRLVPREEKGPRLEGPIEEGGVATLAPPEQIKIPKKNKSWLENIDLSEGLTPFMLRQLIAQTREAVDSGELPKFLKGSDVEVAFETLQFFSGIDDTEESARLLSQLIEANLLKKLKEVGGQLTEGEKVFVRNMDFKQAALENAALGYGSLLKQNIDDVGNLVTFVNSIQDFELAIESIKNIYRNSNNLLEYGQKLRALTSSGQTDVAIRTMLGESNGIALGLDFIRHHVEKVRRQWAGRPAQFYLDFYELVSHTLIGRPARWTDVLYFESDRDINTVMIACSEKELLKLMVPERLKQQGPTQPASDHIWSKPEKVFIGFTDFFSPKFDLVYPDPQRAVLFMLSPTEIRQSISRQDEKRIASWLMRAIIKDRDESGIIESIRENPTVYGIESQKELQELQERMRDTTVGNLRQAASISAKIGTTAFEIAQTHQRTGGRFEILLRHTQPDISPEHAPDPVQTEVYVLERDRFMDPVSNRTAIGNIIPALISETDWSARYSLPSPIYAKTGSEPNQVTVKWRGLQPLAELNRRLKQLLPEEAGTEHPLEVKAIAANVYAYINNYFKAASTLLEEASHNTLYWRTAGWGEAGERAREIFSFAKKKYDVAVKHFQGQIAHELLSNPENERKWWGLYRQKLQKEFGVTEESEVESIRNDIKEHAERDIEVGQGTTSQGFVILTPEERSKLKADAARIAKVLAVHPELAVSWMVNYRVAASMEFSSSSSGLFLPNWLKAYNVSRLSLLFRTFKLADISKRFTELFFQHRPDDKGPRGGYEIGSRFTKAYKKTYKAHFPEGMWTRQFLGSLAFMAGDYSQFSNGGTGLMFYLHEAKDKATSILMCPIEENFGALQENYAKLRKALDKIEQTYNQSYRRGGQPTEGSLSVPRGMELVYPTSFTLDQYGKVVSVQRQITHKITGEISVPGQLINIEEERKTFPVSLSVEDLFSTNPAARRVTDSEFDRLTKIKSIGRNYSLPEILSWSAERKTAKPGGLLPTFVDFVRVMRKAGPGGMGRR